MGFDFGNVKPTYLESFRDTHSANHVARRCPPRRPKPTYTWFYEPVGDTRFNEVTIFKNGRVALRWETREACPFKLELEVNKIIARMKAQFMGKPRLAESYV